MPPLPGSLILANRRRLSDVYNYSLAKECEDVAAVQAATGAAYIFDHKRMPLLAGDKSEPWAQQAIVALGSTIPHAQAAVLPKLEHLAPLNRYSLREVAQCVRPHFLAA